MLQNESWSLRESLQDKFKKMTHFVLSMQSYIQLFRWTVVLILVLKNIFGKTIKDVNYGIFVTEFSENSRISEAKIHIWILKGVFMETSLTQQLSPRSFL